VKKWIGIGIIAVLVVVTGINIYIETSSDNSEDGMYDVSGDPNQDGAYIVSDHDRIEVGEDPPDFEVVTLEGEEVQLSDLKGKKVYLNFWATWCPPCKEEMPIMQEFYDEHQDEVEVVALNATGTERDENDVRDLIDEDGYTYPVLLDKTGDVTDTYNVFAMPTTFFIGTDGTIQKQTHIGPMDYDFMVETMNELD